MNMLTRFYILLWLLSKQKLNNIPSPPFANVVERHYRVLPHDMGWRDHLPNYRYFSFIELNVEQWLRQQSPVAGTKWIIASQQINYLKPIKFLHKMVVKSQVLGWDSKYFYFRHEFYVKYQLMAVSLTKFVLSNGQQLLPTSFLTDLPPQTHPVIDSWLVNQQDVKNMSQQPL